MTLVIAKRINRQISLSSDSRIGFGSLGHIDYGIKVFSVPVKMYSPIVSETNISTLDYDHNLGLGVVGSAINAYTVKESVYEILQHLQYIPGYTDLSMDGIASLVFKVFNKTTLDLGGILQSHGICELILAGYCPLQNKNRIYKFSCDISNYPIKPFFEEILKTNGIEFFGSGKEEARIIFDSNQRLQPLHIIRQVIKDGNVNSVGGGLQYGEFKNDNFYIFGIEDYDIYPDGSFKEYVHTLRGLNIYKDDFERGLDGFHIEYTFKQPFEDEIQQIWKKHLGDK